MSDQKVTSGLTITLDGFGAGSRLFDGVPDLKLKPVEAHGTSVVTHIRYNVLK